MADTINPDIISATRDANAVDNPIYVILSDGTAVGVIPGVGATNLGKAEDQLHVSGDVGVMALAVRQDTQADFGGDGDYVPLSVDGDGAVRVNVVTSVSPGQLIDDTAYGIGTDFVNPQGFLADETAPDSVDEGDIGIARMTLDRKMLMVITDATTDANRLAINATGEVGVVQATHDDLNANVNLQVGDVDVSTTTPVPVSRTTAENTELNPIYVHNVDTVISGVEAHDYDTGSAVASDATSNHDYTVVGGTFLLKQVTWAGSGNVKVEVQSGPVASLVTHFVGFLNARQGDYKFKTWDPAIEVPVTGTGTVRVIRTNRQGQATDVYSTIEGVQNA